ncbi:Chitin synthase, class 7 [Malassezia sp. CBS 17886]|nr:Chitin synthase, class 7 [Malassezia sp. CBS 17886]
MGFSFGNYNGVCGSMALVSCPLLGGPLGIMPECYSRNIDINNTIIFQPATCIIHIAALIMTAIMVWHVHSKYTAVAGVLDLTRSGRKEIVFFFYLYGISELLVLFLDSAVIPTYSGAYLWFTAIYIGLKTCAFWCLMLNGFVGFQFAEDGTPLSLWTLRISTLVFWGVGFGVSAATFQSQTKEPVGSQAGLWFFEFIFPLLMVIIYIISQVILVLRTLDELWPLNDIMFGVLAFIAGLILMYGFNNQICEHVKHYIDGTFFGTLCTLFAVMMVYKCTWCYAAPALTADWDSITREDLEFSVGSKHSAWDTKEPMVADLDGSVQSHDFYGRGSASTRTFNSRPPSPPQQKEDMGSSYALGQPFTRRSSDNNNAQGYPAHH